MIEFWSEMDLFLRERGIETGYMTDAERITYLRDHTTGLFMEVAELMDSFNWKPWRDGEDIDVNNLTREVIDCLFFLHHICDAAGVSRGDLRSAFSAILENNRKRYVDKNFSEEDKVLNL